MQTPLKTEKMERTLRTAFLNLGIGLRLLNGGLLHRLGNFVLEFLTGFLELTHAATETTGKFREFLSTKKKEDCEEDQEPFLSARHTEGENMWSAHLSRSLGGVLGNVKETSGWDTGAKRAGKRAISGEEGGEAIASFDYVRRRRLGVKKVVSFQNPSGRSFPAKSATGTRARLFHFTGITGCSRDATRQWDASFRGRCR